VSGVRIILYFLTPDFSPLTPQNKNMSLRNKRIIVTGAASGIGQQTAKLLKQKRAKIIAFDLNEPKKYVDEFIQIDLSKPEAIKKAVDQFSGGADALCNVAGVPPMFHLLFLCL